MLDLPCVSRFRPFHVVNAPRRTHSVKDPNRSTDYTVSQAGMLPYGFSWKSVYRNPLVLYPVYRFVLISPISGDRREIDCT